MYVSPIMRAAMTAAGVTAGTRRVPVTCGGWGYVGQVTRGTGRGRPVVECGHQHRNRSLSTRHNGTSATDCALSLVQAAVLPASADLQLRETGQAWQRLTRGPYPAPASTVAAARAKAPADVAAHAARIRATADLLGVPHPPATVTEVRP